MKKNLLSVLILALVIVNMALTAMLAFSVIPAAKKTNQLVTQICEVINLELETGQLDTETEVPIEQIAVYDIADSLTVNLKPGADNVEHYAVVSVTLSLNTEDEDYKTYGASLAEKESLIKSEIYTIISGYTMEEIKADTEGVTTAILEKVQAMFDSKFIIKVGFRDIILQ